MSVPFPSPTTPAGSRAAVLLGYLDYFRSVLAAKVSGLPDDELGRSPLPSGWTPLQLIKHVTFVERRWLEWGFEGRAIPEPWGDEREGRWYVGPGETREALLAELADRAARTRATVEGHDLAEVGAASPRWDGADPPTLERVLLHVLQEYARHVGHLDIVRELLDGTVGEEG